MPRCRSNRKRMSSKILPALVIRYHGRCTRCHNQVMMERDANRLDYKIKKFSFIHRMSGIRVRRATIEHIVPRSVGGSDEMSNLTLLCEECNQVTNNIYKSYSWVNYL